MALLTSAISDQATKQKIAEFFKKYPALVLKRGEIFLRPGDSPMGIYYLDSGLVQEYIETARGDVLMLQLFKPTSFFAMTWLVREMRNEYFFEAIEESELYVAPAEDVIAFLDANPDAGKQFTARLLLGIDGFLKRFEMLLLNQANNNTAALISYFAQRFGTPFDGGTKINVPLTHREIASWIGTTRETVSLQMGRLERGGVVSKKAGKLIVKNLEKLAKQAATDSNLL